MLQIDVGQFVSRLDEKKMLFVSLFVWLLCFPVGGQNKEGEKEQKQEGAHTEQEPGEKHHHSFISKYSIR